METRRLTDDDRVARAGRAGAQRQQCDRDPARVDAHVCLPYFSVPGCSGGHRESVDVASPIEPSAMGPPIDQVKLTSSVAIAARLNHRPQEFHRSTDALDVFMLGSVA